MKKIEESQFGYLPVFLEGCENQQYNLGIRLNATLEEAKLVAKQILELQQIQSQHTNLVKAIQDRTNNLRKTKLDNKDYLFTREDAKDFVIKELQKLLESTGGKEDGNT